MRRYLKLALLTSSLLQLQACRTNSQASLVQETSKIASNSASKSLNVPYYCQMNNYVEPYATCSNSSLAMVLDYKGKKSLGYSGNLAEQLYSKFGKLNSIQKISRAARSLGYTAQTRVPSSFDQIKNDINQGHPVIVGGDFVGSAGHYVVAIGYNSKGFIVHDPYGHWDQRTVSPNDGYGNYLCDRGHTGKNKVYSYSAMRRAAGQGFWTVTVK